MNILLVEDEEKVASFIRNGLKELTCMAICLINVACSSTCISTSYVPFDNHAILQFPEAKIDIAPARKVYPCSLITGRLHLRPVFIRCN
jgi:hypothetical protein